jgi:hypothetical protein
MCVLCCVSCVCVQSGQTQRETSSGRGRMGASPSRARCVGPKEMAAEGKVMYLYVCMYVCMYVYACMHGVKRHGSRGRWCNCIYLCIYMCIKYTSTFSCSIQKRMHTYIQRRIHAYIYMSSHYVKDDVGTAGTSNNKILVTKFGRRPAKEGR